MSELARTVGISRQALYLHFPDRAALLLALVTHVDEREDLQAWVDKIQAAPGAAAQIHVWAQMQSRRNPKIAPLARALDQARHTDQAAAQAWRDRVGNRMRGAAGIITRLRSEGCLHPSWTPEEAATLLSELTSFHVWDNLVNDSGLDPDRYAAIITTTALAAFASPISDQHLTGAPRHNRHHDTQELAARQPITWAGQAEPHRGPVPPDSATSGRTPQHQRLIQPHATHPCSRRPAPAATCDPVARREWPRSYGLRYLVNTRLPRVPPGSVTPV